MEKNRDTFIFFTCSYLLKRNTYILSVLAIGEYKNVVLLACLNIFPKHKSPYKQIENSTLLSKKDICVSYPIYIFRDCSFRFKKKKKLQREIGYRLLSFLSYQHFYTSNSLTMQIKIDVFYFSASFNRLLHMQIIFKLLLINSIGYHHTLYKRKIN